MLSGGQSAVPAFGESLLIEEEIINKPDCS